MNNFIRGIKLGFMAGKVCIGILVNMWLKADAQTMSKQYGIPLDVADKCLNLTNSMRQS